MKISGPALVDVENIKLVISAAAFAAQKHSGKIRKGGGPYFDHLVEVAELLSNLGNIEDASVLAAAFLHDTLEKTDATAGDLASRFGAKVAGYVSELTDDESLSDNEKRLQQVNRAASLSSGAKAIKLADKISNVEDVRKNLTKDWTAEKRREYIEWSKTVVDRLRGTNIQLESHFDEIANAALSEIERSGQAA